jgi:hypothetical protein
LTAAPIWPTGSGGPSGPQRGRRRARAGARWARRSVAPARRSAGAAAAAARRVRTVGAHRRPRDLGKLLAGLDVLQHRLLEAGEVLVPVLEHGLQAVGHPAHRHRAWGGAAQGWIGVGRRSAPFRGVRRRDFPLNFASAKKCLCPPLEPLFCAVKHPLRSSNRFGPPRCRPSRSS